MSSTKDLNLFFPFFELNPQGWLNDFISPQISRDKDGIAYSMIYKDFDFCSKDTQNAIEKSLSKIDGLNTEFKNLNNSSTAPTKLFYVNGKYADKLESNVLVKSDTDNSTKNYVLTLNSIKPFQMAFFQPYMKLYYGYRKSKEQKYKWIEFPFSQKFDLDTILNPNDNSFLEGSGIKSVTNDQKFSVGIKVQAEITISYFFSNMSILTRDLAKQYNLDDMPYGFSFQKVMSNLGIDFESLKLEYGYYIDPSLSSEHQISPEICNVINEKEKKEFLLLKTSHNFSFSKEGNVEISVNYKNGFEAAKYKNNDISTPAKSNPANKRIFDKSEVADAEVEKLLDLIEELTEKEKILDKQIKTISIKKYDPGAPKAKISEKSNKSIQDQKEKNLEELKKQMKDTSAALFSAKRQATPYFKDILIKKIRDNLNLFSITFNTKKDKENKIYTVNSKLNLLTNEGEKVFLTDLTSKTYDINDFLKNSPKNFNKAYEKMDTILNRIFNTPSSTANSNKEFGHIVFFPVKALLRAAYEMLSPAEQFQVPAYLFGNLSARVFEDLFYINSGHVLIEVKTFQKWLYDNFLSKNNINFSFGEFVDRVIEDLIPEALYRQRTYPQSNTRLTIQDYAFMSIRNDNSFLELINAKNLLEHEEPNMDLIGKILSNITRFKADGIPLIVYSKLDIPTIQETTACSFNVNSTNDLNLNEQQDAANGIPHLVIGADGGMFMTADFSQIDLRGLRTGIALQSMQDQNSSNFFYYYNLSAQVIGSSVFNFGSFICIPRPPLGFQGGDYDIGIVGYYKVRELKDDLTPGSYKSIVSGDWFWNPRQGKDGNLESSNTTVARKPSDIRDFINTNTLTPEKYVQYLFENNITTITNLETKKKEVGKSKEKKVKKQPAPVRKSPNESKEKDAK